LLDLVAEEGAVEEDLYPILSYYVNQTQDRIRCRYHLFYHVCTKHMIW